ncbi:hypothetical protein [Micromonospora sp. RTP1Z1]|uniref:hypothetical protein n=1 Tax=Micromonospora sp. RTP1Z1 TaxID=2994043 RepID=UPI0029C926E6|nr:hypothetical protein [Micromonospora sp. RTP1Z1]
MTVDGGSTQELLTSRVWPAVLVPAAVLVLVVVVGLVMLSSFPFVPFGIALSTVILAVLLRNDALLADEAGLLVRRWGRVTRSYRWDEVRRAGIARPGFGQVALSVFPHGGPYDVPGPNSEVLVGRVWLLRRPDQATCERIAALLRAHGIEALP